MRILIVRHGETKANLEGIVQGQLDGVLSKSGHSQTEELGIALKNTHIDYVFSSDLGRAVDTAKIILKQRKFSLDIVYDIRLRERNNGSFEGRHKTAIYKEYGCQELDVILSEHGAESIESMFNRAKDFIEYLLSSYPEDSTFLIVGHGGINSSIMTYLEGELYSDGYKPMKNCELIVYDGFRGSFSKTNIMI